AKRSEDAVRRHDFPETPPLPMMLAIRPTHVETESPPRPEIISNHAAGEAFRLHPLHPLGFCETLENQFPRRFKDPLDDEHSVLRLRDCGATSCGHASSPSFAVVRDSHPGE